MKKLLLFCALLVLSIAWISGSQIARMKGELAAARERVAVVEQQRVPKADLAKAKAAVASAQGKMAGLEQELAGTREQLAGAQAQLAASQERVAMVERRLSLPGDKAPETPATLDLVKGSYILTDDTMIYSADAQLKVGNSVLISSPTGLMLSDKEQETVAGDLAVDTPSGTMQATHAFIDVNGGKIEMTADSMSFTNK